MENEGDSLRRGASARKPNLNQKRKAEDEARGDDMAKFVKHPRNPSTEPTTVVFIQVLLSRNPAYRVIRGGGDKPEFLIGQRTMAPGVGKWSFPGGPLPPNKTIYEAARHYLSLTGRVLRSADEGNFRTFRVIDTFMANEVTGKPLHLVTLFILCGHENDVSVSSVFLPTMVFKDWSSISDLNPLFEPLTGLMEQTVKIEKKIFVDWKNEPGLGV